MVVVLVGTVAAVREGLQSPARVLAMSGLVFGVTVMLVRYSLRLKSRVVEARLRRSVEAVAAEAAA